MGAAGLGRHLGLGGERLGGQGGDGIDVGGVVGARRQAQAPADRPGGRHQAQGPDHVAGQRRLAGDGFHRGGHRQLVAGAIAVGQGPAMVLQGGAVIASGGGQAPLLVLGGGQCDPVVTGLDQGDGLVQEVVGGVQLAQLEVSPAPAHQGPGAHAPPFPVLAEEERFVETGGPTPGDRRR